MAHQEHELAEHVRLEVVRLWSHPRPTVLAAKRGHLLLHRLADVPKLHLRLRLRLRLFRNFDRPRRRECG